MRAEPRVRAASRESRSQAASPARALPSAGAALPLFEPGRQSAGARPPAAPLGSRSPRGSHRASGHPPPRAPQHRRRPPAAAFKPSGTHHPRGRRPRPRAPPAPRRVGGTDHRGTPGSGRRRSPAANTHLCGAAVPGTGHRRVIPLSRRDWYGPGGPAPPRGGKRRGGAAVGAGRGRHGWRGERGLRGPGVPKPR